jgi:hypothetical protein
MIDPNFVAIALELFLDQPDEILGDVKVLLTLAFMGVT